MSILRSQRSFFKYSHLFAKAWFKGTGPTYCMEVIKAWIPQGTNQSNHMKKRAAEREGKLEKKTHQHRKAEVFPEGDLCCSQPWLLSALSKERRRDWNSVCLFLSSPFLSFFPPDGFSCLSARHFSCSAFAFSFFSSLAHFLCQYFWLPQKGGSAQRLAGLAANSGSQLVYGSGKLHCHISCFSSGN